MSLPSFLSLYNQLISIPTISSVNHEKLDFSNKALIDKLANWFETLGFTIDIQPVPKTRNKFNMLASYSNNEKQTQGGLLLSGHSDTVPFDEGLWHKDPFTLTEDNNKLYGLGTADMKGFFAFILDALRDMDLKKMTKPIYILATADEETTMAGAAFFSKQTKLQPDCTIIGEPTSLIPIRAHKGFISNSIKVIGKSGHSSDPEKGINAIEIMHLVIERLLMLKQKFKTEYHNEGFSIPYPTLNLGIIHGGDAANRICGCCELIIDIRVLPNNNIDSIFNALCDALQPVMTQYPDRIKIEYAVSPIPGYECEKTNPTLTHIEKLVGNKAQTVNYSTEAPYLNEISPTVVLGPGSIEQAHQPNEFISMDFLKPTKMMFERLIKDFCF